MSDRTPTRFERAAMWLFHDRYGKDGLGCADFWKALSAYDKRLVINMVAEILAAKP